VSAAGYGVKTITLRGQDVLFRTGQAEALGTKLRAAPRDRSQESGVRNQGSGVRGQGSSVKTRSSVLSPQPSVLSPSAVRVLPPPSGETLHEVYLRLPQNYLTEPDSLLAVLRRRLT
jgi:hypothetical protein